jgi:hypothetical protein
VELRDARFISAAETLVLCDRIMVVTHLASIRLQQIGRARQRSVIRRIAAGRYNCHANV